MIEPTTALRRLPLFAVLPDAWLASWVHSGQEVALEPGGTLFLAGTPGTDAYLVLAGRVRVTGDDGREVTRAVLGPGEVFGEYALLHPGLNTATCRAAEPGRVLRLALTPLRAQIRDQLAGRSRLKDWLRLHYALAHLRGLPALGFMSAPSFLPLLDKFEPVRFAAGDTVQAEGFHDDSWFVVRNGQAKVLSRDGRTAVGERGPGDAFGERALLGPEALTTVRAVSDLECQRLRRSALDRPAERGPTDTLQTVVPDRGPKRCLEWLPQAGENDCGPAALAMAARALGRHHTVEELRLRINPGAAGASLEELRCAATGLGLRVHAVRVGLGHIGAVRLPAVAHLRDGHYVTLFELSGGSLLIGDPSRGIGLWPLAAFQKAWSGQLLLIAAP